MSGHELQTGPSPFTSGSQAPRAVPCEASGDGSATDNFKCDFECVVAA